MAQIPCNPPVWPQLITWILVVGGWLVINHQNNTREHRKEVRQTLDTLKERIEELDRIAINFHQGGYDQQVAQDILTKFQRTSLLVEQLGLGDANQRKQAVLSFRRAITYKNFDQTTYRTLNPAEQLIVNISNQADKLIELLESAYSLQYNSRFNLISCIPKFFANLRKQQ